MAMLGVVFERHGGFPDSEWDYLATTVPRQPVAATGPCNTVARATIERFFATCVKIDPRVSTRLNLLLTSLPNGLPRARLQDCVNRLRPFCRGVGYYVDE